MNQQIKNAVAHALDSALTTVAFEEVHRLAYDSSLKTANKVATTLNSLDRLSKGGMPNYDNWDALFYHWYQPSQINLAYSLIKLIDMPEKLHIVDYGCGALAMQFGIALAAADALEKNRSMPEIRVSSIDPSQAMLDMGNQIWHQFKSEARKDPLLVHISSACESIKPQVNPSVFEYVNSTDWSLSSDVQLWFTALHASYRNSQDTQAHDIRSFVSTLSPDACFATTHSSKVSLLQEVWRFLYNSGYYIPDVRLEPQFKGALPEITQWRKNLNAALQPKHSYLQSSVTWDWPEIAFFVYMKQKSDADELPW